jgi:hypothetical protein
VIVWAVDRLVRRLPDLEDLIDRFERTGVKLVTVSGEMDLSTDQGRLVARILASVARGEVERKGALAEIDAEITEAGRIDVLAGLIGVDDIAAAWACYSAERKRPVVDTLMAITLHSPGKDVRTFNPDTVEVTQKR